MSFFSRLKLALSVLFKGWPTAPELAAPAPVEPPKALPPPPVPPAPTLTQEQKHAAALFLLGILQREGRLLDFLQEDISGFADADVGAAARLVHDGCKKALSQYVPIVPVVSQSEGAPMELPAGFDANKFRLTGNVTGAGPFKGALKHHGWVATSIALPDVPTTVDVKVIAPAEIELP